MTRSMEVCYRGRAAAVVTLTPSGRLKLSGEGAGRLRPIVRHYAAGGERGEELFELLLAALRGVWSAAEVGPDEEPDDFAEGGGGAPGGAQAQDAIDIYTQPVRGARRRDERG